MKKLISILFILLVSSQALAQWSEVQNSLSAFNQKHLSDDEKSVDKSNLNIDKMFDTLEKFNDIARTEKPSLALIEQACRVMVLTFKNDPSQYAAEIILPTYQKYRKEFEPVLKKNKECGAALKNSERELSEGNG
ncbi:MAG: hypothetical protein ACLGGX_05565 [Bdellovibrionia bacterium]